MDVGFEVKECGINLVYDQEERVGTQENASNLSPEDVIDGDLSRYEVMTGTYFLCEVISRSYDWSSSDWFEKLIEDSNKTTENEEERRAGQLTVAAGEFGSDDDDAGHCRCQKLRIRVAVFLLSLSSLVLLSVGIKRHATKREKKNGDS
ncbi:uncharacterized protein LOC114289427 [Camellia sinensis]|uniref:uncharacterized protein LOC114289427 n=1 Tax=Camellia sinensis TaxID=4442 RepID=UPI001035E1E5|nr:uncharacterized protein LOC114289427 [Camellia sinensis]XP_028088957.1 uncharacterized protein LOC114289427 [Camellia sinensis]